MRCMVVKQVEREVKFKIKRLDKIHRTNNKEMTFELIIEIRNTKLVERP